MNTNARTNHRQAKANTRVIARKLRGAARRWGVTVHELRAIERHHNRPAGRLFLALAGIRLDVTDMLILQKELGLDLASLIAGTRAMDDLA